MKATPFSQSLHDLNLYRFLRREYIHKLVYTLRIVFIFLIILMLIKMGHELIKGSLTTKTKIQEFENKIETVLLNQGTQTSLSSAKSDYQLIVERNLFGPLGSTTQAPQPTPKPGNIVQMKLIGTFLFQGDRPLAILEEQKKMTQDAYSVGDTLFKETGTTLVSIKSDRVEISRNGTKETLILEITPDKSVGSSGGVATLENDEYIVDEAELDKALENLPLLLTQARAVPYFKEGKSVGLRLFAIRPGSLFEKIGLQNGDVLKSVNGNSLSDLTQAMELFRKIKEERNISLSLERNLSEKEFKYRVQ